MSEYFEIVVEPSADPSWIALLGVVAIPVGIMVAAGAYRSQRTVTARLMSGAGNTLIVAGIAIILIGLGNQSITDDDIAKALSQQLELKEVNVDHESFTASRDGQRVTGTFIEDQTAENIFIVLIRTP